MTNETMKKIDELLPLAEAGDMDAQFELANLYDREELSLKCAVAYTSTDYDEDYRKSTKWYIAAAEQGHEKATTQLAVYYIHTRRHKKDVNPYSQEAFKWITKASDLLENQTENGLKSYFNVILSSIYREGGCDGVEINLPMARKYFMRLFDYNNCSLFAYQIGSCFLDEHKYGDAYKWFEKAIQLDIEGDSYKAYYALADMYENGLGVKASDSGALQLYKIAVEKENEDRKNRVEDDDF